VEARELGVAVPEHLTLDSQWDRDDAASGETPEWCLIIVCVAGWHPHRCSAFTRVTLNPKPWTRGGTATKPPPARVLQAH